MPRIARRATSSAVIPSIPGTTSIEPPRALIATRFDSMLSRRSTEPAASICTDAVAAPVKESPIG